MTRETFNGESAAVGKLRITPITLAEANQYVSDHHRHHDPVLSAKFSVAVSDDTGVRGVAIMGRPVARHLDDGWTLEVARCCTDGVRNGCSMLYGAAQRAGFALGYLKIITYTLETEGGASLRAVGWKPYATKTEGRGWDCPSRPRVDTHPLQRKLRWEAKP